MDGYTLGTRTEVFADGIMADSLKGASLRQHAPEYRNVAIAFDKPWDSQLTGYFSVVQRGNGALLYYRGRLDENIGGNTHVQDTDDAQVTGLAVSDDGVRFEHRPTHVLDLPAYPDNNLVWRGVISHNFTAFYDENPNCPENERFKAVGGLSPAFYRADIPNGLFILVSPDGVHWKKTGAPGVFGDTALDSQNAIFYDTHAGLYRCYMRTWARMVDDGKPLYCEEAFGDKDGRNIRAIQSATSADLAHWSKPVANEYGDRPLQQFYTNSVVPMPGAEHVLLSFPNRFFPERKRVSEHYKHGISDTCLMASRDGVNWKRLFMEAWIRPGIERENWKDRCRMVARGMHVAADGTLSVYVGAHFRSESIHLDRCTLRPCGFVSVNAPWSGGEVLTPALRYGSGTLRLNYSTSAGGGVRADVVDAETLEPLCEREAPVLYGDAYQEAYPGWQANEAFAGRPVRLRFRLWDADVYAFSIRP